MALVLGVQRCASARHHQSSHLCLGFMGASALHPKCFENSGELEMLPMTLNLDGLWGSVMMPSWELSGVRTEHQTCRGCKEVIKKKQTHLFCIVYNHEGILEKVNQLVHPKPKVLHLFFAGEGSTQMCLEASNSIFSVCESKRLHYLTSLEFTSRRVQPSQRQRSASALASSKLCLLIPS